MHEHAILGRPGPRSRGARAISTRRALLCCAAHAAHSAHSAAAAAAEATCPRCAAHNLPQHPTQNRAPRNENKRNQKQKRQVLATLGCIKGKRVLELGAGIGRFTGEIAKTAASVRACDFMEISIEENR